MTGSEKFNLKELIISAQKKAFKVAFERAVRTGTALIFSENGKIVRVKPPYKYVLVPIKKKKRRSSKKQSKT